MLRLVIKPATARPVRIMPEAICWWPRCSASQPPVKVPRMMPMKVRSSRMPLAEESWLAGRTSGMMPYFAGAKIVLWTPMRQMAASWSDWFSR